MRDAGLSVGAAKPSCQPRTSAPTSGERSAVTASVGCRHKVANDPTAAVVACYNLDGPRCACHRYHLKAAEKDPETHCPHASKAGGGMCANKAGKRFDTFCKEYVHGTLPPTRTLVFNEMLAGSVHLVAKLPLPGGLPLVRSQKKIGLNELTRAAHAAFVLCFRLRHQTPSSFSSTAHNRRVLCPPCVYAPLAHRLAMRRPAQAQRGTTHTGRTWTVLRLCQRCRWAHSCLQTRLATPSAAESTSMRLDNGRLPSPSLCRGLLPLPFSLQRPLAYALWLTGHVVGLFPPRPHGFDQFGCATCSSPRAAGYAGTILKSPHPKRASGACTARTPRCSGQRFARAISRKGRTRSAMTTGSKTKQTIHGMGTTLDLVAFASPHSLRSRMGRGCGDASVMVDGHSPIIERQR